MLSCTLRGLETVYTAAVSLYAARDALYAVRDIRAIELPAEPEVRFKVAYITSLMECSPLRSALATLLHRGAAAGVVVLITAAPWAYGGVEEWFRALASESLAAIGLLVVASVLLLRGRIAPLRAFLVPLLPFFGFVAIALLQASCDPLAVDSAQANLFPRSIYPAASRLALAGLVAAFAAALFGVVLFSAEGSFHVLLAGVLAGAAAVAVVGIGLKLTGEDRIIRGVAVAGDPFARFVNRNNAAAYLQLGLAAGLTLLRSISVFCSDGTRRPFLAEGWRGVDRTTLLVAVVCLTGSCAAGIVASGSRGGVLAAAVTLLIGFLCFGRSRGAARFVAPLLLVAVTSALVGWLGLAGRASDRFRSLRVESIVGEGRVPHWQDAVRAYVHRPVWGAGLGTYGYAYQEFARHPSRVWFEHADGQFVELLVEAGAAGLICLGLGLTAGGFGLARARPTERTFLACLVGGQAAHALFDYGIIVPAVALSGAVLWGAGLARILREREERCPVPRRAVARRVAVPAMAAVAAALVWSAVEHHRAATIDNSVAFADRLLRAEPRPGSESVELALGGLARALNDRPDDAEGWRTAGDLQVYLYRLFASREVHRLDSTASDVQAWRVSSLPSLHAAVGVLVRSGSLAGIERMREDPLVRDRLSPARRAYATAAVACPRLPGVRIPLACLSFADPRLDPRGTSEIKLLLRLFPGEPEALRAGGRLAWQAGDERLAGECWRRAFTLEAEGFAGVIGALNTEIGPDRAIRAVCPGEVASLLRIADAGGASLRGELRQAFGEKLGESIAQAGPGPERERGLAISAWLTGDFSLAESRFRSGIASYPFDAEFRIDFARYLWSRGRGDDAREQLRIGAALDPARPESRQLWRDWRPSSEPPEIKSAVRSNR
jgi:hypothetical protein